MDLRGWLGNRLRPLARRKPNRLRGKPALGRPSLECLETRTLLSAFSLGSTGFDTATSVKLDSVGNEYVCGTFNGTVDFDPGPGTHNLTASSSNGDAFVAKYTANGQLLWVGQLPGSTANALTLDPSGNLLVTGSFPGTVDFDFGPGTTALTAGQYGAAFVAKYTPSGGLVWAKELGGQTSGVSGDTIAVDAAGNVYSAGVVSNGQADMDPGPGTFVLTNSSGNANTYISKLDASGNFVWAKMFSNDPTIAAGVWPEDMGVDGNQQVYVSGIFTGRVNFDTSGGTHWVSSADGSAGYGDAYVARLTAAGGLDYVATIASPTGREDGYGIAVDAAGDAYVTGAFMKVAGQQPSPLTITPATGSGAQLTLAPSSDQNAANSDLFVLKLNPAGGLDWARSIGGPGFDGGQSIALGSDGLYLTGFFQGTVDFDPNAGVHNATDAGGPSDVFILKLATDSTFLNVWTVGGSDYEYGNDLAVNGGGSIGVVGRFQGSGDFDPGPGVTTLTSAGSNDAFVILFSPPNGPHIWTGASEVSANWSDPANWTGGAPSGANNVLVFAAGSSRVRNTNDLAGLGVSELDIQGGWYVLGGNPITLSGNGLVDSPAVATLDVVNLPLTLAGATVPVAITRDLTELDLGGAISGSANTAFQVSGTGVLDLLSSNPYQGLTRIQGGEVLVSADGALGSAYQGTQVLSGATLRVAAGLSYATQEPTFLSGTGFQAGGENGALALGGGAAYAGPLSATQDTAVAVDAGAAGLSGGSLNLNGRRVTFAVASGATLNVADTISDSAGGSQSPAAGGRGQLIKGPSGTNDGGGTLRLTADNRTLTDATVLNSGTLLVNGYQPSSPVTVAGGVLGGMGTAGPLLVQNGGTVAVGDPTIDDGIAQLTVAGDATFQGGGSLRIRFVTSNYGQLIMTGTLSLPGDGSAHFVADTTDYNGSVPITDVSAVMFASEVGGPFNKVAAGPHLFDLLYFPTRLDVRITS